ncbi:MAG: transposase [Pirellulaceae bacterium]|nr:transposase [Pirellulaceae bacterium]
MFREDKIMQARQEPHKADFDRATEEAKQLYKRRKKTVELSFADIKEHRGLRRFPRRGLTRATTQVGLAVLVHNLLVVHRVTETQ